MNKERFLIIDDDPSICQMLANIIEDNDLGEVIDMLYDGTSGIDLIPKFKPDIVFVDLLLPDIDGIEIVKTIKKNNQDIDFIMISQVSDTDMITEAYESGIEFYINKPINVIEVTSVTKRVIDSQRNRRVLKQIGKTLNRNQPSNSFVKDDTMRNKIEVVFAELGILSEKGSQDLLEILLKVSADQPSFQMSELYAYLSKTYISRNETKSTSTKAIEQRVRRTIQTALVNVANLGIEDFGNYKFDRYASSLFGFQEVRKVMNAIRNKQTIKATINSKLFINGLVSLVNRD